MPRRFFYDLCAMTELRFFDPTVVPIAAIDTHLPKPNPASMSLHGLRQRFLKPPPWKSELSKEPRFSDRAVTHAAVLIPLVKRERVSILLTTRTANLSSHSGQIAFPGGKVDASDESEIAAALREAHEEVGLTPNDIEVLGILPTYSTGSGFIVTPVVALVQPDRACVQSAVEVADVFEVPLDFLMDPTNHRHHVYEWEQAQRHWISMPYQDGTTQRFIWGATAAMLRNLYRFLSA